MSTVVKRYLLDKSPDRHVVTMTLDDAAHYSAKDKARITAQYPDHERDTRTRGIPQMGSGRVFLVDEEKLLVDPFDCQDIGSRLVVSIRAGPTMRPSVNSGGIATSIAFI